jgi:hypothetical protein
MKTQYLVAGFVAAALFALTPDASAHGGVGHGGGNWAKVAVTGLAMAAATGLAKVAVTGRQRWR